MRRCGEYDFEDSSNIISNIAPPHIIAAIPPIIVLGIRYIPNTTINSTSIIQSRYARTFLIVANIMSC